MPQNESGVDNKEEEKDEIIVANVQNGDSDSFNILIARYQQKMMRYGKRFLFELDDIKDLVQDVFVKAYVNIKTFDIERRFSPWLYRIAHNEFVNALKKKQKRKSDTFPLLDFDFASPETADGSFRRDELRRMFYHSLHTLDPIYREPIILYYFEEMDYKTIAEILNVPVSTVGVRLQRGKAMLKKVVEKQI
jgi:RNA polymerase sigma-70 factor, ECF subfamily